MDYSIFTAEHEAVRKTIRKFVDTELMPHTEQWEKDAYFADWVFPRMGELGFLSLRYPEKYGGAGGDYFMGLVLAEEMARCCIGGLPMAVAVQTDMATPPIMQFGTEEQKQKYLVPALKGQKVACLGITEPNAGSDVASIQTRAVRDGDYWVINGRKTFITNGVRADFITLVAKTNPDLGYNGVSLFLVDKGTPGFTVTRKLDKVGMRSSDTAELLFEDCRVRAENLLGVENRGFHQIMWELQGERLIGAAGAVAGAQYTFEKALAYARQRVQFGKPLVKLQVIAHRLAEMATEIEAARQLVYSTARKFAAGEYPVREISMAKLVGGQVSFRVADMALQIYGGYGYMMEYDVQRAWRDSRLYRIGGGTDEIMKEVIAKTMGL
ncbi:acyl-CoA dehydrogenase family protein [Desulfotruncus alcoholivorax]|uniref:acyl-CoA dehydrogenase family protein n=1 Tax=Desulfotruncus alcoholivorax TaxID=265477 RepID=UPI0004842350|nr:acyl-CoA dehydrogenase family protein [Desulfotruncus alcoholivorax]